MKISINDLLRHLKLQLIRIKSVDTESEFLSNLSEELRARQLFLDYYGINLLLDVGANSGQYATLMRRIGYKGKIISFEPLKIAFAELKNNAKGDRSWECENFALGDNEQKAVIHVAGNSYSSSLLDILPSHIDFDANSKYVSDEEIQIKRLDDVFHNYCDSTDTVMLKIDTQGFEKRVLEGSRHSLRDITLLQLEMSIEPLYENEVLFVDMINYLHAEGFDLFALENGIRNPRSGKLLQADGVFLNRNKTIKIHV